MIRFVGTVNVLFPSFSRNSTKLGVKRRLCLFTFYRKEQVYAHTYILETNTNSYRYALRCWVVGWILECSFSRWTRMGRGFQEANLYATKCKWGEAFGKEGGNWQREKMKACMHALWNGFLESVIKLRLENVLSMGLSMIYDTINLNIYFNFLIIF